jgi:multidrug resistance efflux pump
MDGVVSLLNVKKGERVVGNNMMAGTEMMRVADMSKMEIRVDVGENDIPKVHLGDSALIEVDAYNNRKFKGIVTQIASSNTTAAQTTAATSTGDVTNYKGLYPDIAFFLCRPDRSIEEKELSFQTWNECKCRYSNQTPRKCFICSY